MNLCRARLWQLLISSTQSALILPTKPPHVHYCGCGQNLPIQISFRNWTWGGLHIPSIILGVYNGLFQKKKQGRGVEDTLFWTSLGIFRFLTLPLEIPDKTKLHPIALLETPQNCVAHPQHPSEILRPKTKTPGNSTWFFLDHPWNSTLFLINPWKFDLLFLQYPWKFYLQLSNLVFLIAQLATSST